MINAANPKINHPKANTINGWYKASWNARFMIGLSTLSPVLSIVGVASFLADSAAPASLLSERTEPMNCEAVTRAGAARQRGVAVGDTAWDHWISRTGLGWVDWGSSARGKRKTSFLDHRWTTRWFKRNGSVIGRNQFLAQNSRYLPVNRYVFFARFKKNKRTWYQCVYPLVI